MRSLSQFLVVYLDILRVSILQNINGLTLDLTIWSFSHLLLILSTHNQSICVHGLVLWYVRFIRSVWLHDSQVARSKSLGLCYLRLPVAMLKCTLYGKNVLVCMAKIYMTIDCFCLKKTGADKCRIVDALVPKRLHYMTIHSIFQY